MTFEGASGAAGADDRGICAELVVSSRRSCASVSARCRSDCRCYLRHRDWRRPTIRESTPTHGLSWSCTQRTFDRRDGSTGWHHEGRQWTSPPYVGRKRLDVSASTSDWCEEALPAGAGSSYGARHRLESTDAPYGTLSRSDWAGQKDDRGLHGDRTRARRLHVVGCARGADRFSLAAHTAPSLAQRRGRNHGRGNARQSLCGRLRADARCKIGTAPDAHSEMR